MTAAPVLDARDVVKRFGEFTAVAGVSFEIRPGECYGLLGPNGAGKTTLFKLVTSFARRDGGALTVFGLDPQRAPSAVKARLGVVGQEDNLDADLDVISNLRVHASFFGLRGPELEARIDGLLELLELSDRRRAPIMALSGGMKRRLAIVRALLNAPELLLLDEPTTGLDPQIRHAIWNVLRVLKAQGLTLMLTTHYMEEAAQLADRVGIQNLNNFNFYFTGVLSPMSLFSGMVFPVADLPHGLREVAYALPMFHVTELNRLLLFGPARCVPFVWVSAPYLLLVTVATTWWGLRAIERRIVQ